jgi:hypothetical protein
MNLKKTIPIHVIKSALPIYKQYGVQKLIEAEVKQEFWLESRPTKEKESW